MSAQQDRLISAQMHEAWDRIWTAQIKKFKSPKGSPARRLAKFYRRMARNNRRALRRNA